jgi:flagellar biosynthesis protein FliQ
MTPESAIDLLRRAFIVTGTVAGPMVFAALIVGVLVGVLQAATQINEASVSFVTKLIAVILTFAILGSWSLQQLVDYTTRAFQSISTVVK